MYLDFLTFVLHALRGGFYGGRIGYMYQKWFTLLATNFYVWYLETTCVLFKHALKTKVN